MHLAPEHGASVSAVSLQDVIETWDRGVVQMFVARGADLVAHGPCARLKAARHFRLTGVTSSARAVEL